MRVVLITVLVRRKGFEHLVLLTATHASFTPCCATPSCAAVAERSVAVEAVLDAVAKFKVAMVVAVGGSMVPASGGSRVPLERKPQGGFISIRNHSSAQTDERSEEKRMRKKKRWMHVHANTTCLA